MNNILFLTSQHFMTCNFRCQFPIYITLRQHLQHLMNNRNAMLLLLDRYLVVEDTQTSLIYVTDEVGKVTQQPRI